MSRFTAAALALALVAGTLAPAVARAADALVVPSGDLVSVEIESDIGSRISSEGDAFGVLTVEDYYVRGKLVLPKGSPGYGTITHVKRAGIFHAGGELTFAIKRLVAPDGTEVNVETNGATADADRQSEKNGNEAGSYLLFGLGGLFARRGNDILIRKGVTFHVATLQTRDVPSVAYGTRPASLDERLVRKGS